MSAIALLWRHDGMPVDGDELAAMLGALEQRAPDGVSQLGSAEVRLAACQHWTTPEDAGKPQAVRRGLAGFDLAWDGRLDNRDELLAVLADQLDHAGGQLSDAELAAAAYERWGDGCFARFLGPFAAAVVDRRRRRVVCVRDPLGDRTLVWALRGGRFAAASEEAALLALPWVGDEVDEAAVAAYLAARAPAAGDTFFADIHEIPPAHTLVVEPARAELRRYWELDSTPLVYRRDGDYVEHFLAVFEQSVRCRLRSRSRVAVLMSGGLDSTSVAAIAAAAASGDSSRRPLALSWVFDELLASDERRWIAAMAEACPIDPVLIRGDDAWPLSPLTNWFDDPNLPIEDPYRVLHERAWAATRQRGATVVLSGGNADELYAGGEYWLADMLRSGRLAGALAGLAAHGWWHGVRQRPTRASARRVLARALRVEHDPLRAPEAAPGWLSEHAARLLRDRPPAPRRGARTRGAGDPWDNLGLKAERSRAARAGVEVRRPYRDRRLVELCSRLPAFVLLRPGASKWVARQAMRGRLPDMVRLRAQPTSLLPLFVRGVCERASEVVATTLADAGGAYAHLLCRDRLRKSFASAVRSRRDGPALVVPWYYLSLEQWTRGRREQGRSRPPRAEEQAGVEVA